MWRDIDSLRKQNESTKKEIESMRRKSEQTEIETEQLRSETEILRRQNKTLEFIKSIDLGALFNEATIPGCNDSKHPEAQLNLELIAKKLVALGCDTNDIPFLLDALKLTKENELGAPRKFALSASASQGQASRRNNSRIKTNPQGQRDFLVGGANKIGPAISLTSFTNSVPRYASQSRLHEARVETQWLLRAGQRRDSPISR
jgi:hypothetical protein